MLTICGRFGFRFKLTIPNNNIRKQYYQYLINQYNESAKIDIIHLQDTFDSAAIFGKWKDTLGYIAERYYVCSSNRNSIEGERNIQGYYMAYLSLCPYYVLCPEVEMNHGYCDIFLMPDHRFKDVKHSYIVELKHVKTTDKPEETEKKIRRGSRAVESLYSGRKGQEHDRRDNAAQDCDGVQGTGIGKDGGSVKNGNIYLDTFRI